MTARLFRRLHRLSSRRSRHDWIRGTSAAIERLEDRTLLAGMWTDAFPAGTDGNASVTENPKFNLKVAIADDGQYVLLWQDSTAAGFPLYFRRFLPNGTPLDPVERHFSTNVSNVEVGMAADGGFVIVFQQNDLTVGTRVFFSRFSAGGLALQNAIPLGSSSRASFDPDVAVARDGRFVITWEERVSTGNQDIAFDVFAADGSSASGYAYADAAGGNQLDPRVAINPVTGEFAIAYMDDSGEMSDVYRTIHRPDGALLAGRRQMHPDAAGEQYDPDIAMTATGDLSVVWVEATGEWAPTTTIWHGTENYYGLPGAGPTETAVAGASGPYAGVGSPVVARSEGRDTVVAWSFSGRLVGVKISYR